MTSAAVRAGRAIVPGQDGLSVRYQEQGLLPDRAEATRSVAAENSDRDLDSRLVRDQRVGERREIFHVRSEKNRFARENRLDRILPAARREAFADKNNRGDGVPMLKLASGIEKKTIRWRNSRTACFAPQADAQAKPFEVRTNFPGPLHVSRGDDQGKRRESARRR